jgi:hypothetical protein
MGRWNEDMTVHVSDRMEPLKIEVFDEDVHDDDDSMVCSSVTILNAVSIYPEQAGSIESNGN